MSNAAWLINSDVFNVAGPSAVEGLNRGWSPKLTVNVLLPLTCTMVRLAPLPGTQSGPLAPQSECLIVTLWSSSCAKQPSSGSKSRAIVLRLRMSPRSVDEDIKAQAGAGGDGADLRVANRERIVRVAIVGGDMRNLKTIALLLLP